MLDSQGVQNSALYRRGVVLPLDDDAERQLLTNCCLAGANVQYLPIETEGLFEQLWALRVIQDINLACDVMLDDYEEDWIPADKLKAVLKIVRKLSRSVASSESVIDFLVKLAEMLDQARRVRRPVLFVL